MRDEFDIFRAKIHWESGDVSITDVTVPKNALFIACYQKMENKDIPMWVIRQEIVERFFQKNREALKMQSGVVLCLVDKNDKEIISD